MRSERYSASPLFVVRNPLAAPDPDTLTPVPPYDWSDWYDAARSFPPRETLLKALALFEADDLRRGRRAACPEHSAIDLGAGDGRDTIPPLARGWRVWALEASREGLRRIEAAAPPEARSRLTLLPMGYQDDWLSRLPGPLDLVNASFSIPHCRKEEFPLIWRQVVAAIKPGGRFAGQLFGPDDSWATGPPPADALPSDTAERVFHTREQALKLLAGFDVEFHDEVNRPGKNARGLPKHWHVHHLVARKR